MSELSLRRKTATDDAAPMASHRPVATTTGGWTALDLGIMALVAVLALLPRTANLLGLDPFVDEAAWVDWALRLFDPTSARTWLIPVLTDGRPPLFVWLTVPFGAVVDNGILAGRLASACAGAASAAALYALGRELASRLVGLVAAILWALSPLSVFFARIAADDALLTLLAILATWSSVRLARAPTQLSGARCGLALALAVWAKTTGVLLAVAPLLAIVLLGRPRAWRAYVGPLAAAGLVGLLVSAPLLLGVGPLLRQVAIHTGSTDPDGRDLLLFNAEIVRGWLDTFVGDRFLALAGAGALLALLTRQLGLVFAALLCLILGALLLDIATPLFARYLLVVSFPLYLLAAYAIALASASVGAAARQLGGDAGRLADGLRLTAIAVSVLLGLVIALGERADLAADVVLDPARAAIPGSERMGYVENWYAVYGLGQVAAELRARAAEQPITVLVPPASREGRVIVPYAALRMYLRRAPNIRIVEAPALWRAQDLRELRSVVRQGPTYLVVNGSYTPSAGMPDEIPAYTRQLERRLRQDLPDAREVLRIPRPTAPHWLSLHRLDGR